MRCPGFGVQLRGWRQIISHLSLIPTAAPLLLDSTSHNLRTQNYAISQRSEPRPKPSSPHGPTPQPALPQPPSGFPTCFPSRRDAGQTSSKAAPSSSGCYDLQAQRLHEPVLRSFHGNCHFPYPTSVSETSGPGSCSLARSGRGLLSWEGVASYQGRGLELH